MDAILASPLFWASIVIALIGAVVTVIWKGGIWYGAVNSERDSFKESMTEIRKDIKAIFLKLSPPVTERASPIRLTDLGNKVSGEVDAKEIAKGLMEYTLPKVRGKSAYDIQEFCFEQLNDGDLLLSEIQLERVKKCAFENGIETLSVRRVIAIELRNLILSQLGLELK